MISFGQMGWISLETIGLLQDHLCSISYPGGCSCAH